MPRKRRARKVAGGALVLAVLLLSVSGGFATYASFADTESIDVQFEIGNVSEEETNESSTDDEEQLEADEEELARLTVRNDGGGTGPRVG